MMMMLHQEVFRGIGANHRFGHGDEPHLFALENRPVRGRFQSISKEPIKLMDKDDIEASFDSSKGGRIVFARSL